MRARIEAARGSPNHSAARRRHGDQPCTEEEPADELAGVLPRSVWSRELSRDEQRREKSRSGGSGCKTHRTRAALPGVGVVGFRREPAAPRRCARACWRWRQESCDSPCVGAGRRSIAAGGWLWQARCAEPPAGCCERLGRAGCEGRRCRAESSDRVESCPRSCAGME
jgi:hypothetical protein